MLNEKVRSAITRLTSVSADAKIIADRLLGKEVSTSASYSEDEVIALRNQIEILNGQVAELRLLLASQEPEEEDPLDDAAEARFKTTFDQTLGNSAFAVLDNIYNEEYISSFPRQIRYLMALCLVNWCNRRKFAPTTLWNDLMVNNGSM